MIDRNGLGAAVRAWPTAIAIAVVMLLNANPFAAVAETAKSDHFVWKPVRGDSLPPDAFSAAPAGAEPVRLCRVRHNRDIEVGQIVNSLCAIGGDGMSRPYSLFLTLVEAPGVTWAKPAGGTVPANAVALNDGFGPTAHGCRVSHDGQTVVGMVRDGICSAGFNHGELRSDAFEVLVYAE